MKRLRETAAFIRAKTSLEPKLGVTLGSGLSAFVDVVETDVAIPYSEIPHFCPPTVEGHPGQLVIGKVRGVPVAILQGRIHFYEGHSPAQVVFATRVLKVLGIQTLVLTNAAGGLDPVVMKPGHLMILKDHINLTGMNPLIGPNLDELGPRFPDMSRTYDPQLVEVLGAVMKDRGIAHSTGVYCGVSGPSYETAAEIRFYRSIGAHAVGMSTVAEAIVASHMGLRLCGMSCITNLGTGLTDRKITHDEVKEIARRVESDFSAVLQEFIARVGAKA